MWTLRVNRRVIFRADELIKVVRYYYDNTDELWSKNVHIFQGRYWYASYLAN